MSANQEMLAAFDNLANTITSIRVGNAIQKAQEQAQQIRNNQKLSEFDQIKAQQSIAQATSASILALGGTASDAQQARLALVPEIPDQAMRAMEATGKKTLAEAQQALKLEAVKNEKDMLKYKNDLEMEKQRAHDAKMLEMAGIKAQKPPKGFAPAELKDMRKAADIGQALTDAIGAADQLSNTDMVTSEFLSRNKRVFNILKANAQDIITRLRTGAALNKDEEAFYANLTGSMTGGEITPTRLKETLGLMRDQFYKEFKSPIEMAMARGDVSNDTAVNMAAVGMKKFNQRDLEFLKSIRTGGIKSPDVSAPSGLPVVPNSNVQSSIPGLKLIPKK